MKALKSSWIALLLILPYTLKAQEKGIHFEHKLTWAQVEAKAKAENKYIFVDCYTSYCGPCKMMDTLVYNQEVTGKYFNDKFISVKVQMDRTAKDNDEIKAFYDDAAALKKEYHVAIYPTFLYFDPNGKIVHRMSALQFPAEVFVARSANAFNPEKQYYSLLDKFDKHLLKDPDDIRKLALTADTCNDQETATKLAAAYIATQSNLYTAKNIDFLNLFTRTSKDNTFKIFLAQCARIDAVLGKGTTANKVQEIALNEDYFNDATPGKKPAWKAKEIALNKKYPGYGKEIIARFRVEYYLSEKQWRQLAPAMKNYVALYPADILPREMDGIAQQIFNACNDPGCLKAALAWSKCAKDRGFITSEMTYANLTYKMGNKDAAIMLYQKMISKYKLGAGGNLLTETIDKMHKGEKTWDK